MTDRRELGRGERVVPGLWRLRLPLPFTIPHANAWAIAAGERIVLVDTGAYDDSSIQQLERALDQVGLRIEQVGLVACTHAHPDHWGQAAPVRERAGCELWMHPNHAHGSESASDPAAALAQRLEVGRQSGAPEQVLQDFAEYAKGLPTGVAAVIEPDRLLVDGVTIDSDLGTWTVYETPGHAPSHICLYQPEHRILISGDHLLGRIAVYYEYGWTPDPAGEFLTSLDVVARLDARLCLSGHGRPFVEVPGHIEATRKLVREQLDAVHAALDDAVPRTAVELIPEVYGEPLTPANVAWLLWQTLSYLTHLEQLGKAVRERDGDTERWRKP